MKKFFSFLLALTTCFSLCTPILAVNPDEHLTDALATVAGDTIQITTTVDEGESTLTTYSNIALFVETVHNTLPDVSNEDVAYFLASYTGQNTELIPLEDILDMLTYSSISTTASIVVVDDNGISTAYSGDAVPAVIWTSDDEYMQIDTCFGKRFTLDGESYYNVWATATWLDYPAICMQDAFVIGTSGTFDDSVTEKGWVHQTFKCRDCNRYTYWNRSVDKENTIDDDLSLEYDTFVPVLHFDPITARCEHCGDYNADDILFSVYLKYGMIADESVNIQSGYAHKTLGIGNISVGIDISGTPSFSAGLSTVKKYIARPVTVN